MFVCEIAAECDNKIHPTATNETEQAFAMRLRRRPAHIEYMVRTRNYTSRQSLSGVSNAESFIEPTKPPRKGDTSDTVFRGNGANWGNWRNSTGSCECACNPHKH